VASLRIQLIAFWLLLLGVCAGLGIVMVVLYQNSAGVQIGQARALTQRVCEAIATRYQQSRTDTAAEPQLNFMQVVLQLALVEAPHVEGGVWDLSNGFLAYAYPTYEGGGTKRDVPEAERAHIAEVARAAVAAQTVRTDILRGTREALVLTACPLPTSGNGAAAWTMTRVPAEAEVALRQLRVGLSVLLAAVVISGAWVGMLLTRGFRHIQRLESALATEDLEADNVLPLKNTGVEELDRIISAVNRYSARLHTAQAQARTLLREQAHNHRLTALGRMLGGIAHEIRNPIATMRLQAENALAASPQRHPDALQHILQQIDRLDRLVQNLLATVQPLQLQIVRVPLSEWLVQRRAQVASHAAARDVTVREDTAISAAYFDPLHVGRAIDNLLDNAVRHALIGGCVRLQIERSASSTLILRVTDNGLGVIAELRDHLFEPFATSRAEGTGLGLALVREIALAHGGDIRYLPQDTGACFELELPWRES
jgi:signal transduction histidine kinase